MFKAASAGWRSVIWWWRKGNKESSKKGMDEQRTPENFLT